MQKYGFLRENPCNPCQNTIFAEKLQNLDGLSLEDGAATATAFTAESIAYSIKTYLPELPKSLILCGGGANNPTMVRFIRQRLPEIEVRLAREEGWNADAIEAQAFAYLAARRIAGLPITFPSTTGAPMPLIGGEIHMPQPQKS